MSTYYLRLEIARMVRDVRNVVLAVGSPIGFYLLFATLLGGGQPQPGELPGFRVEPPTGGTTLTGVVLSGMFLGVPSWPGLVSRSVRLKAESLPPEASSGSQGGALAVGDSIYGSRAEGPCRRRRSSESVRG
jgi:hypothetical protein